MNYPQKSFLDEDLRYDIIELLNKSNEKALSILQENEKFPGYGLAEAYIYNIFLTKLFLKQEYSELFEAIRSDYDLSMIESLKVLGVNSKVPNLFDFLNERNSFFLSEFNAFLTDNTHLASRLFNIFYENPLSNDPVPTTDFVKLMPFHLLMLRVMSLLKTDVREIAAKYQSAN